MVNLLIRAFSSCSRVPSHEADSIQELIPGGSVHEDVSCKANSCWSSWTVTGSGPDLHSKQHLESSLDCPTWYSMSEADLPSQGP
jgi:hypothetical protein